MSAVAPAVEKEPFDASNPEHVRKRKSESNARMALQREGMKEAMRTKAGRAWVRHLIFDKLKARVGKDMPPPAMTGNSFTYHNIALRELGDLLCAELETFCPDEFELMKKEGYAS